MKVRELITALSKCNPEALVKAFNVPENSESEFDVRVVSQAHHERWVALCFDDKEMYATEELIFKDQYTE